MIDREHALLVSTQAKVLNISRGSVYYLPRPVPERDLILMRRMDELHLNYPFAGAHAVRAAKRGGLSRCINYNIKNMTGSKIKCRKSINN
jgi:putative transposase